MTPTLLSSLESPVVIVGAAHEGKQNGMTAAWVTQVSLNPCLVAVAVAPHRYTHRLIAASGAFALSVLRRSQAAIARDLGMRSGAGDPAKLRGYAVEVRATGSPILSDAGAYMDCRVRARHEVGDHTLFVGEVVSGGTLAGGPYLPFTIDLYS